MTPQLQGTLSNQCTNLPSLDRAPTSHPPPHLGLCFLASCLGPRPILYCSSQALPPHGQSGPLPSTPPESWSSQSLTCPWCSPLCSCTRNRGAGRGSSGSRCSHGAHWHIHPPGGRTGRPRRPQVAHTSALTWGHQALLEGKPLYLPPSPPGPCSYFPQTPPARAPTFILRTNPLVGTQTGAGPAPHPQSRQSHRHGGH